MITPTWIERDPIVELIHYLMVTADRRLLLERRDEEMGKKGKGKGGKC